MKKIRFCLKLLIGLTFGLIALGGSVRAMNAGLACPDWPLCFGKFIPDFHIQVYFEFIHRVVAGFVGLFTLFISGYIFKRKNIGTPVKRTMVLALVILIVQIVMGGLTVLKLLHFGTVTAHLALGILFLGTLSWALFQLSEKQEIKVAPMPKSFVMLLVFSAIVVFAQILLGGLVSSNYAGLACTDFPLCQGELIPSLEGALGIHVIHRLGAYFTLITMLALYLTISSNQMKEWVTEKVLHLGRMIVLLTVCQIGVGIANIKFDIPPIITVLHLAIAASIFAITLRLAYLGVVAPKLQTRG